MSFSSRMLAVCAVLVLLASWQMSSAQPPAAGNAAAVRAQAGADFSRIEFQVVQSFDARYEGDTPGHSGRVEGLASRRVSIALGDAVYRAGEQVGVVTGLGWSPSHGTLEVEFRPEPNVRVAVADTVWVTPAEQPAR